MVTVASRMAGIHRRTWYLWRKTDPAFDAMVEEAHETVADDLEAEAIRRAMDGSDSLLMFLLRGRKPEIYGNRKDMRPRPQSEIDIISMVNVEEILESLKKPDE